MHPRRAGAERIEVGDQVTPDPVHVDHGLHVHLLHQVAALLIDGVHVLPPLHRLVGDAHRPEHVLVEAVLPQQQPVDPRQERPRLGSLDDAVVVRRGQGDDLAHPELGQHPGIRGLVLDGVVDGTDPHDQPLAGHQPWHRHGRADGAGVGQADGGAGEVVDADPVRAHLADELLVGEEERAEVQRVGGLDARHEERPGPVGTFDVHGQPEADVGVMHDPGRPPAVGVGHEAGVHGRHRLEGPDHGVADHVGEAHLAATGARQVIVEDRAVDLQQLGRYLVHARGGGHPEAGLHVGHDACARAADGRGRRHLGGGLGGRLGRGRRGRRRLWWSRRRRTGRGPLGRHRSGLGRCPGGGGRFSHRSTRRPGGCGRRGFGDGGRCVTSPVVGEELLPALAHR